jgi:hypothetical protein
MKLVSISYPSLKKYGLVINTVGNGGSCRNIAAEELLLAMKARVKILLPRITGCATVSKYYREIINKELGDIVKLLLSKANTVRRSISRNIARTHHREKYGSAHCTGKQIGN